MWRFCLTYCDPAGCPIAHLRLGRPFRDGDLLQPRPEAVGAHEGDDVSDGTTGHRDDAPDAEKRSAPEERPSFAEELSELIARRKR